LIRPEAIRMPAPEPSATRIDEPVLDAHLDLDAGMALHDTVNSFASAARPSRQPQLP